MRGRRPLIALAGFMGAGKSTVGEILAGILGAAFVDTDEAVEERAGLPVAELFARDGEAAFRALERATIAEIAARARVGAPIVMALGGGALGSAATRALLAEEAEVVWLDVTAAEAWLRVQQAAGSRPLARDEQAFRALFAERRAAYAAAADSVVDAGGPPARVAAEAAVAPLARRGAVARLESLVGDRRAALVVDAAVAERIGGGWAARIVLDGGEGAKTVAALEALWRGLAAADLERRDAIVAVGGGTVTDAVGFAAATFRRGIPWIAVPTTLVGQLDAAIGGKTAINVAAKNDVGAFHLPEHVIVDPDLLATLSEREWANGYAEALKTGLLAGGRLHALAGALAGRGTPDEELELVRGAAAYKTRIVVEDPTERGLRAVLNLGHTIGHAVEAVAGYGGLAHGEAVAVGLSAALWLSVEARGLDPAVLADCEAALAGHGLPLRAPGLDRGAVLDALRGDKKRSGGRVRFVLLEAVGRPVWGVELEEALVHAAVERALSV